MLVVHPANQDLANSDGLRLSRSVDPGMERSMLVLTKIDLMDKGERENAIKLHKWSTLRSYYSLKIRPCFT